MNNEICSICLDPFENHHTIARPDPCHHPYHVICISLWLNKHNSCPLCRREVIYDNPLPWRSIIAFTLVLSQQQEIERSLIALAFLETILQQYPNAQQFKEHVEKIIHFVESITVTNIKLPFMAIPTRSDALKERRKWKGIVEGLLEERVSLERLAPYKDNIVSLTSL